MLGLQTCWAMSIRSKWVRGDRVCVLPMCRDSSVEKPEGKGSPGVGWRRQPSQRLTVPVPSPGLTRMLTCPQRTSLCKFKFQRKDLRVSLQQVPKDTAWERAPKQGMPRSLLPLPTSMSTVFPASHAPRFLSSQKKQNLYA